MKIRMICQECFQEGMKKDIGKKVPYIPSYPYWESPTIELDKWPYFEVTCPNGHINRFTLTLELYELLFQQATYCIMDGYFREAIATYNAALERFMEYALEVMTINSNESLDYNKIWYEVRRQSERQLGAYYFTYATQFKELPIFLDNNMVNLRNDGVHKGKLATREEAKRFGKYVFEYIRETANKIQDKYGSDLPILKMRRMFRLCEKDYQEAMKHPIKTYMNEIEEYKGIGSTFIPCFLNMDNIMSYEDCFKVENILDYGLLK